MNLTLLFDGTWNDPQDRTNVFRLCTSLADHAKDRGRQRFFYDPGVGTARSLVGLILKCGLLRVSTPDPGKQRLKTPKNQYLKTITHA